MMSIVKTSGEHYDPKMLSWRVVLTLINRYKERMSLIERTIMVKYLRVLKQRIYSENDVELKKMLRCVYDMLDVAVKEGKI